MKKAALICLLLAGVISAQTADLTYIHLKKTGVEGFLKENPSYDGRGALIFIFDTGIDVGTDGLLTTTQDGAKILSVNDFSGEGDIQLSKAVLKKEDGKVTAYTPDGKFSLNGIGTLNDADTASILIGCFGEGKFKNSVAALRDINGNGKYYDNFGIIAFRSIADGKWKYAVDTDADGGVQNDKIRASYNDSHEYFSIPNKDSIALMSMTVNLFPEKKKANFFFDDNSHGTHVAGIAAGYKISEADFNGVAPGANLAAFKISDNSIGGGISMTGAMKKAFLAVDSVSKEGKYLCIVNMSFGIGSELEGLSDMELFLDSLLSANPYMYVFLSAGNEGPGLSSVGLPSTARNAFSSGAVLMQDIANDQYFSSIDYDIILHFSSRGGEFAKPDAVSPGACASSVPQFSNPRKWGTSMASPYSAGAAAVILSACKQEMPEVKVPSQLLFKAMKESAIHMDGYTHLDEGAGLINVDRAYSLLKHYIASGEMAQLAKYDIHPIKPLPEVKAANVYVRDFNKFPEEGEFEFAVKKIGFNGTQKPGEFYKLVSDSKWLKPKSDKLLQSGDSVIVALEYDKDDMNETGLNVGRVTAYREDVGKVAEFNLTVAAVFPEEFTPKNDYRVNYNKEKAKPGINNRYYFKVPKEGGLVSVKLSAQKGKYCNIVYRLFDPSGKGIDGAAVTGNDTTDTEIIKTYSTLKPGVYEVIIYGNFMGLSESRYDLAMNYYGISATGVKELASAVNNEIEFKNTYKEDFESEQSAKILGYRHEFTIQMNDKGVAEYDFYMPKNIKGKQFNLLFDKKDYSKFTDIGLQILDENDSAIVNDAAHYAEEKLTLKNNFEKDSVKLKLVITGGFALKNQPVKINITELSAFSDENRIDVELDQKYMDISAKDKKKVKLKYNSEKLNHPGSSRLYGTFSFKLKNDSDVEWRLPFVIN